MTSSIWNDAAVAELTRSNACPVCGEERISAAWCRACGADFRGEVGAELWHASLAAASALEARQRVLEQVPRMAASVVAPRPAAGHVPRPPSARTVRSATTTPTASTTVQSVLAVAGAGLVAVAASVFTFFNPDITEPSVRTTIVAVVAAAFLAGAWLLARRRLRMSAEAVGALGMVFLALVIASTAAGSEPRVVWAMTASAVLSAGSVMSFLGWLVRLRVWFATSYLAVAAVPAMYGTALGTHVAIAVGALGSAVAAFVLIATAPRLSARFAGRRQGERVALTILQFGAALAAIGAILAAPASDPAPYWLGGALVLAAVAALGMVSSRHPAGAVWALCAGVTGIAAFAVLPAAFGAALPERWTLAAVPGAAVAGLLVMTVASARLARVPRIMWATGALVVVALTAARAVLGGMMIGLAALIGAAATDEDLLAPDAIAAVALGLALVAAGLHASTRLDAHLARGRAVSAGWLGAVGTWFAVAAVLVMVAAPGSPAGVRVLAPSVLALAAAAALTRSALVRSWAFAHRLPVIVGAHTAIVLAGVLSTRADPVLLAAGGGVTIIALLAISHAVPAAGRFAHAGAAYAYGLLVWGLLLERAGIEPLPLLCLVAVAGGAGAIVATFAPVPPRQWWAILAVTIVPFAGGVVQVVFERSAWTALSTGVLFALALTLTATRRPGLGASLRALAAGAIVPALAVVAVCLGAQFLAMSGSPVVLPVIAALVALVLPARRRMRSALAPRIGAKGATWAALAIELSALLTGAIAVALALVREAAGAGTAMIVLLVLAAGAAATAQWGARGYGWWLAGAALTGALWCGWVLAGVGLAEAFLLPPALAAALVGAALTARGHPRARALFAIGLVAAIAPLLGLLAVAGSGDEHAARAYGLVAASAALTVTGRILTRRGGPVGSLAPFALGAAILAGSAGAVQGVRWGLALDAPPDSAAPLVLVCLGIGAAGAIPAAISGSALTLRGRARRAALVPAVLFVPLSAWAAITRDWVTIWTMWGLMMMLLLGMVAIAARGRGRSTTAPPVAVVFALAFVTAVVAWSPRELRVEWFSLPLGLLLITAGALGLGAVPSRRSLADWPRGARGSWALLGPGIAVTFAASVSATYTDPQTWRAILVIVLALTAILVGAARRLAAPFLVGIVVLPVENALAFLVQIGRGIESMPWWITLSVVGAVLLIIAVTDERRAGAGIGARLRDLR